MLISKSVSILQTLDDFNSLNILAVNPHKVHTSDHLALHSVHSLHSLHPPPRRHGAVFDALSPSGSPGRQQFNSLNGFQNNKCGSLDCIPQGGLFSYSSPPFERPLSRRPLFVAFRAPLSFAPCLVRSDSFEAMKKMQQKSSTNLKWSAEIKPFEIWNASGIFGHQAPMSFELFQLL